MPSAVLIADVEEKVSKTQYCEIILLCLLRLAFRGLMSTVRGLAVYMVGGSIDEHFAVAGLLNDDFCGVQP